MSIMLKELKPGDMFITSSGNKYIKINSSTIPSMYADQDEITVAVKLSDGNVCTFENDTVVRKELFSR